MKRAAVVALLLGLSVIATTCGSTAARTSATEAQAKTKALPQR
jgi:hypothetical protein